MKKIIFLAILFYLFSISCLAQIKECPANPDNLYKRQSVLEQFAKILKDSVPEYKDEFYIRNERSGRFSIHDLTDPTNSDTTNSENCVDFINRHIYHIYPNEFSFSFSHIIILEDGNFKIFKSVNCKGRGDSIEDVITYLDQKLAGEDRKDEIIERVRTYRKYGRYPRMCPMASVQCN